MTENNWLYITVRRNKNIFSTSDDAQHSLPEYPDNNHDGRDQQVENDSSNEEQINEVMESESIRSIPISADEIKKCDIVRFKRSHETNWITGEILSRAGKCTGKYKTWWNIKDIESGHQKPEDVQQFESLEKIMIRGQSDGN